MLLFFVTFAFLITPSPSLSATTLHVPTAQYPTIQSGIDAAVDGDTVLVADGTYKGEGNIDLNFKGKAITVQSENGTANCIIDGEGQGAGAFFENGEDQNSILSGFTIRHVLLGIGCYSSYSDGPSSPSIINCVIINNSGAGGINCYESSPIIMGCTVSGNKKVGIGCISASPTISNCIVSYNDNEGISCYKSSPEISNCIVDGNSYSGIECVNGSSANITSCTVRGNSTGISISSSSVNLTNSTVVDNNHWGIYCYLSSPIITNCRIESNHWEGIYSTKASPIISNCIIGGNEGGVIFSDCFSPTLTNCLVTGNIAPSWSDEGGGIYSSTSSVTVINCTITANTSGTIGGIYISSGSSTIINTIAWGNTPSNNSINSDTTVSYSDIEGYESGTANMDIDPQFVGGNIYRLLSSSPCIDRGTSNRAPDTDIEGNPRPQGAGYDMGAYEFVPPCPDCSGDDVAITGVKFPCRTCECIGTKSITIGPDVTIPKDAKVTLKAPTINVKPGFHAEIGAVVNMRRE